MQRFVFAIFALLLSVEPVFAKPAAVLSSAGRRRLEENLEVLKANRKDLAEALETTKKNLEVVKKELGDLDVLEKEHLTLKTRYKRYVDQANAEMAKNQKAGRDLEKWEREHRSVAADQLDAATKSRLETIRQELTERLKWRTDAQSKIDKIAELSIALEKNLRDIRSRREPLRAQATSLQRRNTEFEAALQDTISRLDSMEKQLKAQNLAAPSAKSE